jgi:sporulation protein YtfJ
MRIYDHSESIENLIDDAMGKIKTIVDSSTVIGEQVEANDGTTIIPISKVSVGYVVGGGEYADLSSRRVANHFPMAGGSSGGISVTPVGFLLIREGEVSFINVENKSLYQTILNMFNTLLDKIDKKGEENEQKN